jgi:hypothetical protein
VSHHLFKLRCVSIGGFGADLSAILRRLPLTFYRTLGQCHVSVLSSGIN